MSGSGDGGVPSGAVLMHFAAAGLAEDPTELTAAREAVRTALGEAAVVDAAAVVGIFNAVVKVADATGIPLESHKSESSADLRRELGIDAFRG